MSGVNSENGLETFEQWLKRQIEDTSALTQDALASWREVFDELEKSRTSTPKVGLIKLPPIAPGEYRYAVAIRDDAGLWLTLWVKRTKRGEFFVLIPVPTPATI